MFSLSNCLTRFIDRFRIGPLRRLPLQTFRYLACGAINFVVTIFCYAVGYNFIFAKQNFNLGLVVVSPHVAALGVSLPVNFFLGFWLQRNISFQRSPLRGRVQLFRYFATALAALLLNYGLTKLFVDICRIFPTVAQIIIYCLSAILTFVAQKHYAFRGAERP
jgi:putative flippase GtrA